VLRYAYEAIFYSLQGLIDVSRYRASTPLLQSTSRAAKLCGGNNCEDMLSSVLVFPGKTTHVVSIDFFVAKRVGVPADSSEIVQKCMRRSGDTALWTTSFSLQARD
jgi:hypothetical protein